MQITGLQSSVFTQTYPAGIGTLIQHRDWILTSSDMKTTLISDRYMYTISIRQKTNVHSTLYFIGDI